MKMDVGKGWRWWLFSTIFIWMLTPTSSFCPPLCSCDDATLLTDCHEAGNLKMVPIFLNPQTKFLSLAQNQIKEISMSLHFYSELHHLDFSQNQIEGLGSNNFENLRNLKVLNVSYNSIRNLENSAFSGLRLTIVLDLSVNQIESLDQNAFRGLPNLRELYLDRNRLEALDWDLFSELETLERLSLRFNFIRLLQPPASYNPFLVLNSNNIENTSRGSIESEKVLPLTSASQNPDPSRIRPWTLPNVIEVDLSWNQLAAVKNYGLAPLLQSLRNINLCCNYIHTVEQHAFSALTQNPISLGLRNLNLSHNRLTSIPSNALEKLGSSLVELDLSSNRLNDDVPQSSFRSLFQLKVIKLSENTGIKNLDSNALLDNIHLVEFEANHLSNLTEFPLGLFNNKPYLQVMSLQFGQISKLPEEIFKNPIYNSLVSTLDLYGNPIDCNCSAWGLFQHVVKEEHLNPMDAVQSQLLQHNTQKSDKKIPLGSIQCYSPPGLSQLKIRDLTQSDFEHCFHKTAFPSDHFELLVIILAAIIVFLILLAIGIKLCCLYRICPNQKQSKGNLPNGKDKSEGTTLDEFCSNVGLGGVCGTATSNLGGKILLNGNGTLNGHMRDYRAPVPPSPALSCKSKNNIGLPSNNGSIPHNGRIKNGYVYNHHRIPRNTNTLGPRVPIPYDYEEEDGYLPYTTINKRVPPPGTMTFSNKLRFNPKMQLVLDADSDQEYPNSSSPHSPHLILYEYDYPDYRNGQQQRGKQVPSVLV